MKKFIDGDLVTTPDGRGVVERTSPAGNFVRVRVTGKGVRRYGVDQVLALKQDIDTASAAEYYSELMEAITELGI
jgi:hypothetical protein